MKNNHLQLSKFEIQLLESLGFDPNSQNLQEEIQEMLETSKVASQQDFDTGGISKAVNWQGGGDFIYFEMAKWNEKAKEIILEAESLGELIEFFDKMCEKYFLNYNLKIQEFRDKIIQEESFQNLPLAEQKQIFMAMLDNNQMYVNASEMSDAKFSISEEEQALTEEFYKG